MVLIPFNDKVSVSQKIKSSEERTRLKQLLQSIKPKNFGIIVRTVAEGKRVAELDAELKVLLKHWEETITKVQSATKLPTLVYEETSRTVAMLRDLFNPSYENIYVNDEEVYQRSKGLCSSDSSRTREHCKTLHRSASHFRQLCHHKANQIIIR